MADKIVFSNPNLGGISDGNFQGQANSFAELVCLDIHSEPGVIKVNQALKNEIITSAFCTNILPCSNGYTYFFYDDGTITRRSSAWVYTNVASAGWNILGAAEFEGYIYYALPSYLERININTGDRDVQWKTFVNKDIDYHPMITIGSSLFIGDGNFVIRVSVNPSTGALTYLEQATAVNKRFRICSLGKMSTDLLIGTTVKDNVVNNAIVRWNTWSQLPNIIGEISEAGINSFIASDDYILVQTGNKGNVYVFNGEKLQKFKRIFADWSGSNASICLPNASDTFNGIALFGMSDISVGAPNGIYSIGSYTPNYPLVLNLEYTNSQSATSGIKYGAIQVVGNDVLISWKIGSICGVDRIDWALKYNGAYFTTRVLNLKRSKLKASVAEIPYVSLPTGTTIRLFVKANYGNWVKIDMVNDEKRKLMYSRNRLPEGSVFQFKVVLVPYQNTAPVVEGLEITME